MIVHVFVVEEKMKAVNIIRYTVEGVKAEHVARCAAKERRIFLHHVRYHCVKKQHDLLFDILPILDQVVTAVTEATVAMDNTVIMKIFSFRFIPLIAGDKTIRRTRRCTWSCYGFWYVAAMYNDIFTLLDGVNVGVGIGIGADVPVGLVTAFVGQWKRQRLLIVLYRIFVVPFLICDFH